MAIFTTLIDVMEQIGSQYVHHHQKLDWTTKTMPHYEIKIMFASRFIKMEDTQFITIRLQIKKGT